MQECAGWRIRAVDHNVTVHARASNGIAVGISARHGATALDTGDRSSVWRLTVMRSVVAFVAQEWRPRLQQRRDVRTVWRVTVGAIFTAWLMLPKERAALFRVAGRAGFGHGILRQQLRA